MNAHAGPFDIQSRPTVAMLVWFRTCARLLAFTALLVFVVGSGAIGLHAHSTEGLSIAVKHDASAHRFGAATKQVSTHTEYCLACGWRRSVRQRPVATVTLAPIVDGGVVLHLPVITARPSAILAARPPLRGPPTSPVSA